jgi:hypothetical protein
VNYAQSFQYDEVVYLAEETPAGGGNWTRRYEYETTNNRLKSTHIGDNANLPIIRNTATMQSMGIWRNCPILKKSTGTLRKSGNALSATLH